jgi:hypothetical protein
MSVSACMLWPGALSAHSCTHIPNPTTTKSSNTLSVDCNASVTQAVFTWFADDA